MKLKRPPDCGLAIRSPGKRLQRDKINKKFYNYTNEKMLPKEHLHIIFSNLSTFPAWWNIF